MLLMRLAARFDGRIGIHDHIFTKPLRALYPFPTYPIPHLPYSYFYGILIVIILSYALLP